MHNESPLVGDRDRFFNGAEYVSADSAFKCTSSCVPMYKKPRNSRLGPREEHFNTCMAHGRVRCEHCFGILKGKWQSLRGLRLLINDEEQYKFATNWIIACMILHNLAIDDWVEEEWLIPQTDRAQDPFYARLQVWRGDADEGKKVRNALRDLLYANRRG